MSDPLALLARADKWFLSATDGIAYAPPSPRWLDSPGFWDEATLHHYSFAPLFTVSALDADGREIAMRPVARVAAIASDVLPRYFAALEPPRPAPSKPAPQTTTTFSISLK